MNTILSKEQLSAEVFRMEIKAPEIAQARKPGQFIILQMGGDFDERIPLTIADASVERGSITLIFQAVGESTHRLALLEWATASPTSSVRSAHPPTSGTTAR